MLLFIGWVTDDKQAIPLCTSFDYPFLNLEIPIFPYKYSKWILEVNIVSEYKYSLIFYVTSECIVIMITWWMLINYKQNMVNFKLGR